MPNFAIIENNKVVNVVVADFEYALQKNWIPIVDDAGIDWDYIDGKFYDNRKEINNNNTNNATN